MDTLELLKSLSNDNRLRIINLLIIRAMCLCEIEIILNIEQSICTKHIKKLEQVNLINVKRVAAWKEYSINKDIDINWLKALLSNDTNNKYQEDIKRLSFYDKGNYDDLFDNLVSLPIKKQFNKDYNQLSNNN